MGSEVPKKKGGNHEEYLTMMAGPHRRKVTPLGSPSLIRHQAFWRPLHTDGKLNDQADSLKNRCRDADDMIRALFVALKGNRDVHQARYGGPASEEDEREGFPREAPLFDSFMDNETGAAVPPPRPDMRLDSYRSIKLNFLWRGFSTTLSFEIHIEFTTLTAIVDMSDRRTIPPVSELRVSDWLHCEIVASLLAISAAKKATRKEHRKLYDSLYFSLWRLFDEEILAVVDVPGSLGDRFLEFRGLVVEPAGSRNPFRRSLFKSPYRQARWRSGFDKQHRPRCTLAALEKVHPFLKCTLSDNTEFTVSTLLEERAFFAASLGRQSGVEERAEPFTYFIYEDTLNAWQLGRVVYRINRAGTARIAATMHFDSLRTAGDTLLAVANHLDEALRKPSGGEDMTSAGLKTSTDRIRLDHSAVEEAVANLPERDKLDGSLHYRIDRSEYYQSQFERVTKSLRMGRVEGYQQYDEFVGQRLGPAYEYIHRLGAMYDRVQSDRALLLRRLQSQDALYEEKQIARFQETAEIALFLVLGPYYVGSIVEHIIATPEATQAVWIGALVWGMASFSIDRRRKKRGWKRRLRHAIVVGFTIALGASLVVYHAESVLRMANVPAAPPQLQQSALPEGNGTH